MAERLHQFFLNFSSLLVFKLLYFFYSKIKLFQTILKMFLKTIYHSWIKFILHVYEEEEEEEAKAENNIQLNTMVMYMKKYELVLNINKKLLKRRWVIESVNDRWTFVLLQRSLCVANFRMSFLFVYVVFFFIFAVSHFSYQFEFEMFVLLAVVRLSCFILYLYLYVWLFRFTVEHKYNRIEKTYSSSTNYKK